MGKGSKSEFELVETCCHTVWNPSPSLNLNPSPAVEISHYTYRSETVNSKSFVGKVLLRIKWKFELIYAL